jgi:hypothetical protein
MSGELSENINQLPQAEQKFLPSLEFTSFSDNTKEQQWRIFVWTYLNFELIIFFMN